jgi:putative membrane protein
MKLRCRLSILLGPAILFPGLLFGQFDPASIIASQNQPTRPQQPLASTPSTQDSAPNSGDVGQVMQDKMFLRKAAEGGIAEVKLGQLAVEKASSNDVKAFGQKMVEDHTKINSDIARVADSMGVMLPKTMSKDDQAEYDKLGKLSANDFDIEYLTYMVNDHHQDLRAFRIEAASPADPALRDEVVKAESIIHSHKVMVDKLARSKGVAVPAHGSKSAPAPTA